jgi:hypothetical protein
MTTNIIGEGVERCADLRLEGFKEFLLVLEPFHLAAQKA